MSPSHHPPALLSSSQKLAFKHGMRSCSVKNPSNVNVGLAQPRNIIIQFHSVAHTSFPTLLPMVRPIGWSHVLDASPHLQGTAARSTLRKQRHKIIHLLYTPTTNNLSVAFQVSGKKKCLRLSYTVAPSLPKARLPAAVLQGYTAI